MAPVMSSVTSRLHRQVAVGEVAHLVEEPQNRLLVLLVLPLGLRGAAPAVREEDEAHHHQHDDEKAGEEEDGDQRPDGLLGLQRLLEPTDRVLQLLGAGDELRAGLPGRHELLQLAKNRAHVLLESLELLLELSQLGARLAVPHRDDRERVAPVLERPDEVAQVVGVLADQERHLGVDDFRPEDLGGAAAQAFGEDREPVGAQHLARRGARLAHERGELLRARGHFLGADADLGDVLRERDQVVAGGQDGRGRFRRLRPALGQLVEAALQLVGRGGRRHVHPEGEAALLEDLEIVRELVAAVLHLGEGRGLAAGREAGGLGQALRVVLHLGGHGHVRRALRTRRGVQEHHQRGEGHEQQRDGAQDVHLGRDRHVADQRKREIVQAEERPRRDGLLRRAAAQDRRRPAGAGRGTAGRQVRHRRRGGGGGARARLRLGRDETAEPVRERCLGFCRRCFGHGVLRAAWYRWRRRGGARPIGFRPPGSGFPSRGGPGRAPARSRPRRP